MAKPIKITPILRGKDAVNFLNKLSVQNNKKVNKDRLLSIRKDAQRFKAKFIGPQIMDFEGLTLIKLEKDTLNKPLIA